MIELLMVVMIISILGAVAIPQFLDFRNDAKAAVTRKNLEIIQVAIYNQLLQSKLRCGMGNGTYRQEWEAAQIRNTGVPNYTIFLDITLFGQALHANDITVAGICTVAQLPDPNDRRFFNETPTNAFFEEDPQRINYFFSRGRNSSCRYGTQCCFETENSVWKTHWVVRGFLSSNPMDGLGVYASTALVGECTW